MAPRREVNEAAAADIIGESLGLSMDDLGGNPSNAFDADDNLDLDTDDNTNLDGDDLDGDDILGDASQPREREEPRQPIAKDKKEQLADDLSVTHTPKDEFDIGKRKPTFDNKGNILGSNGRVIATAGREARMFVNLHNTRERLQNTVADANRIIGEGQTRLQKAVDIGMQVANELKAMREVGQAHTRAGLNDTEFQQAIELAAAFKKDQVGAIKTILTRAAASGIDLTSLGLQPGGFDTKALLDLIRSEVGQVTKPIQDRNQQETEQNKIARERQEAENKAVDELNQFMTVNPDAKPYVANGTFKKILETPQFANMSLGEIWSRIQLNLMRRQFEERDNPQPGRRQQRTQNRQQPRGLPNGRGNPGGGNERDTLENELAPVTESYENILKDVMKSLG